MVEENKTIKLSELKEMLNNMPKSIIEKGITNLKSAQVICEGTLCPKIMFITE